MPLCIEPSRLAVPEWLIDTPVGLVYNVRHLLCYLAFLVGNAVVNSVSGF